MAGPLSPRSGSVVYSDFDENPAAQSGPDGYGKIA
jgi:hypothetical protein